MKNCIVSVIIPNYNGEKYIEECLESVLTQSFQEFEIIIIDDDSTDRSMAIIESYAKRDERISYHKQCSMNASVARNRGIEMSKGKYLFFLDSDDMLCHDGLEVLIKNIEVSNADLAIGYFEVFSDKESYIKKDFTENGLCETAMSCATFTFNPSNKIFRKEMITSNNLGWGNVKIGQDMNFFLKYLLKCQKVMLVDTVIYRYRISPTNMTHSYDFRILDVVNSIEDVKKLYKKNNAIDLFNQYISGAAFQSFYTQMEKQRFFKTIGERRLVVNHFHFHIKQLGSKLPNVSRKKVLVYKLKMLFKPFYIMKLFPEK